MQSQFDSFSAFLNMGGYGFFVWLAFGITALSMLLITAHSLFVKQQIRKTVAQEQARAIRILEAREKRKRARQAKTVEQTESSKQTNSNLDIEQKD
ncbi:heme exporter protein CcmD [Glaciecola sp. KUL10]|uniref:heme exporter protein CcmD n=1 Tax=Glaciecola sp. (strain KUL10) TaxID=2161813 RepID=UPI000D78C862|nr:heme exporter protein CcmD [Glaciecola sp. KUL10]GBL04203.1 Heme exporter protein D [Glaciecola sp. KUL10]